MPPQNREEQLREELLKRELQKRAGSEGAASPIGVEPQGILGKLFNVPGAAVRGAIQSVGDPETSVVQGFTKGAKLSPNFSGFSY